MVSASQLKVGNLYMYPYKGKNYWVVCCGGNKQNPTLRWLDVDAQRSNQQPNVTNINKIQFIKETDVKLNTLAAINYMVENYIYNGINAHECLLTWFINASKLYPEYKELTDAAEQLLTMQKGSIKHKKGKPKKRTSKKGKPKKGKPKKRTSKKGGYKRIYKRRLTHRRNKKTRRIKRGGKPIEGPVGTPQTPDERTEEANRRHENSTPEQDARCGEECQKARKDAQQEMRGKRK